MYCTFMYMFVRTRHVSPSVRCVCIMNKYVVPFTLYMEGIRGGGQGKII